VRGSKSMENKMIKEVLVVEGKMDVAAIHKAVEADCIITGGFSLQEWTLANIDQAYKKRGIIILTDPDSAGERIRKFLAKRFPEAKHAFVPRDEATANDDIGVEQASPASIRKALAKVRTPDWNPVPVFSSTDLITAGLSGTAEASGRRAWLGAVLGIGCANAKTFLLRLNHYGVTRQEFEDALQLLHATGRGESL
jgi:ribonuclease M5